MFKASLISTVFAAMAIPASADPHSSVDLSGLPAEVAARIVQLKSYGDRFEPVVAAALAEWSKPGHASVVVQHDLSVLPPDLLVRVTELQQHGDRFESVIQAILTEATRPDWSFDGCGHETALVTLALN